MGVRLSAGQGAECLLLLAAPLLLTVVLWSPDPQTEEEHGHFMFLLTGFSR